METSKYYLADGVIVIQQGHAVPDTDFTSMWQIPVQIKDMALNLLCAL